MSEHPQPTPGTEAKIINLPTSEIKAAKQAPPDCDIELSAKIVSFPTPGWVIELRDYYLANDATVATANNVMEHYHALRKQGKNAAEIYHFINEMYAPSGKPPEPLLKDSAFSKATGPATYNKYIAQLIDEADMAIREKLKYITPDLQVDLDEALIGLSDILHNGGWSDEAKAAITDGNVRNFLKHCGINEPDPPEGA